MLLFSVFFCFYLTFYLALFSLYTIFYSARFSSHFFKRTFKEHTYRTFIALLIVIYKSPNGLRESFVNRFLGIIK